MLTFLLSLLLAAGCAFALGYFLKHKQLEKLQLQFYTAKEQLRQLESGIQELKKDKEHFYQEKESAELARFEAEKQHALMADRLLSMEKRIKEWEQDKESSLQHARAAIFEVGNQLSTKLIEEHKRYTEEAEKRSNTTIKETTEKLQTQFTHITQAVATLDAQVKDSKETVDVVKRALLSPVGAGSLAEITLENIFHASGLTEGRDFKLQYAVTEGRLRPDAVVFLPAGHVLIVDSKASKFFLEMEMATEEIQEKIVRDQLKTTMRNHIKNLASKDYLEAVKKHLEQEENGKETGGRKIGHVSVVMFLPSEVALEKLRLADHEFMQKAWKQDIFPAGPAGLVNILSHARFSITREQQQENHRHIMEEVRKLLSALASLYEHTRKVGAGLQSAASNYDKLAGSFNASLLPKARNLQKLGIQLPANKTLPKSLDRYQLVSLEEVMTLDAEEISEAEQELLALEE